MTKIDELVKLHDETRAMERKCREVLTDHVRILELHLIGTQSELAVAYKALAAANCMLSVYDGSIEQQERANKYEELAKLRLDLAEERRRRR